MKFAVVWLDQQSAKIFHISSEKMERQNIRATQGEHHTHQTDHLDTERGERRLFVDIVPHLVSTERMLILGPGLAKDHFMSYLTDHFPDFAKKVVGVETVDHPTDAQIVAFTRKFFSTTA